MSEFPRAESGGVRHEAEPTIPSSPFAWLEADVRRAERALELRPCSAYHTALCAAIRRLFIGAGRDR